VAKPGDFFVGVTDLFSVLLPGAVLTFVAMRAEQSLGNADLLGLRRLSDEAGYTAFVVSAFLFGHLVDMAGASILDSIYDLLYADFRRHPGGFLSWLQRTPERLARKTRNWYNLHAHDSKSVEPEIQPQDPLFVAARSLAGRKPAGDRLYQWCRDWLALHHPQSLLEPDRLQANSKFFRALVVVNTSFVALFWLIPEFRHDYSGTSVRDLLWMAGCLFIAAFSFLRYSDLRWKAVQHVYRLYTIAHSIQHSGASAEGRQPASGDPPDSSPLTDPAQ
jgi:hypothetical protein